MQVAVTIEVSLRMSRETFDVSAAFPSEMPSDKSVHIRAPSCGLPAVWTVSQKYDLASHLRARERLTGPAGLTKLRCARAVLGRRRRKKTAGDSDPARRRRVLVWYKIRSNLPASDMKVLINSHVNQGLG